MFKNVRLYRLETPFEYAALDLETLLEARRFRPCGAMQTSALGWTSPMGEDGKALTHGVGGCVLMCARKQERLLPAAAITEMLDERVAEIESEESRDVGRAERRRLREQLITEMLPRAFTRSRRTRLYVDPQSGWLCVDAGSEKQAEEVVSLLRETLGSLPLKLPEPEHAPTQVLTGWLLDGGAPQDFAIGEACELRDPGENAGVVRISGHDLACDEVLNHLRAGKQVVKLALDWEERFNFVLADDLSLKRLRMGDTLLDELDDDNEDPKALFDAEFALLSLQLRALIERLDRMFGLTQSGSEPQPRTH